MDISETGLNSVCSHELEKPWSRLATCKSSDKRVFLARVKQDASYIIPDDHRYVCNRVFDVRIVLDQVVKSHESVLIRTACKFAPKSLEISAAHRAISK